MHCCPGMSGQKKHARPEPAADQDRLALAAIGMEAEFVLLLDDVPVKPEDVFGSPRNFIRGELMHRRGTSYHLPNGGAIYFDTGVIEIATAWKLNPGTVPACTNVAEDKRTAVRNLIYS